MRRPSPRRSLFRLAPALLALGCGSLAAQTTINQFPLPAADLQLLDIAAGPDGNLWFVVMGDGSPGSSKVGRITTAGAITEFVLPDGSQPIGICSGPDGAMWFTESKTPAIGRLDPATFPAAGSVTHFAAGIAAASNPFGICPGPDGALWFTERDGSAVGRITTSGTITEFPISAPAATPLGIVAGPDGNLWFTDRGDAMTSIGVLSPSGTLVKRIQTPGKPAGIAVGPDGRIWFVEFSSDKVGVLPTGATSSADITEFATPTPLPYRIAAGPDGNLWFTENGGGPSGRIARITTSGTITEFTAPGLSGPYGIALGPDRAVWFTERDSVPTQVGQLVVDCVVDVPAITGGGGQCSGTTLTLVASPGWDSYRWSLDGAPIPGATAATYTKTARPEDTGSYTVAGVGGSCVSNPSAPVSVTIDASAFATTGGPQTICAYGSTAGLGGNAPAAGSGTWSAVSGGAGTFSPDATTPNATFTHTSGAGPITLRWSMTSASCSDSADVVVTVRAPPAPASAGGPQTICNLGASRPLGGNTPAVGTGNWSVVSGGTGTFSPSASAPNATFLHTGGAGPIVLAWTVSNAPCAPSVANVTLTIGATCPAPLAFYPVTPCRRVDTRLASDGPALAAGEQRSFVLAGGPCAIPASARAVSINLAVTAATASGDLKSFPTGTAVPTATAISFGASRTRANNAVLALSWDGTGRADVKSGSAGTVHVVVDVNGYFR